MAGHDSLTSGKRELLLLVAGMLALSMILAASPQAGFAPANALPKPANLLGSWQGTLWVGKPLRVIVRIGQTHEGWEATMYGIDQGTRPIKISSVTLDNSAFKFLVPQIGGVYEGTVSADGDSIDGKWTQGADRFPLTLVRVIKKTARTTPVQPPSPPLDWSGELRH
jgi:hypothetical protein